MKSTLLIHVTTPTESYSGFALYTTDSLLVMAPEALPKRPDLPGAYTVPRSEIVGLSRARAGAGRGGDHS